MCVCVIVSVLTRPNPLLIVCTCSKARRGNFGRWGIRKVQLCRQVTYHRTILKINCSSVWCWHYTFSCAIMHFQTMNLWRNCPSKNCAEIAPLYHTSLFGCSTFIASDSCGTKPCLKAAHFLHLCTRRWMVSSSTSFLSVKYTFGSKLIKCALSSKNSLVALLRLTEFLGSKQALK